MYTETVGLLGTGAQDVHLDFHTAPEFWQERDTFFLTFYVFGSPQNPPVVVTHNNSWDSVQAFSRLQQQQKRSHLIVGWRLPCPQGLQRLSSPNKQAAAESQQSSCQWNLPVLRKLRNAPVLGHPGPVVRRSACKRVSSARFDSAQARLSVLVLRVTGTALWLCPNPTQWV